MLTINATNVIRVLRALTPHSPFEDHEYHRLYHVRAVMGMNLTVDIYNTGDMQAGQGLTIEKSLVSMTLSDLNDDTKYERINASMFPMIVKKDAVTGDWTIFNLKLYPNIIAARAANPTLNLAVAHTTDDGKLFILDALVDIA